MVVLLSEYFGWNNQLDGHKLVAFSLKSVHNLRNLKRVFFWGGRDKSVLLMPSQMYRDKTKQSKCVMG